MEIETEKRKLVEFQDEVIRLRKLKLMRQNLIDDAELEEDAALIQGDDAVRDLNGLVGNFKSPERSPKSILSFKSRHEQHDKIVEVDQRDEEDDQPDKPQRQQHTNGDRRSFKPMQMAASKTQASHNKQSPALDRAGGQ